MSETSTIEWLPPARQYPELATTRLNLVEAVMADPEAKARGLLDTYQTDPDFRARIARFEQDYADLGASDELTTDTLTRLIASTYSDAAVERRAAYLADRSLSGDPTMHFDINFCTYLDLAMPISSHDTVTPDQVRDGKLYWIDYILREGEHVLDRRELERAPELSRSQMLRSEAALYLEKTKNLKWLNSAKLAGGTALIAATQVAAPEAVATPSTIAGIALIAWGGLSAVYRKVRLEEDKRNIQTAEASERLTEILPKTNPKFGFQDALQAMHLDLCAAELAEHRASPLDLKDFWRRLAIKDILADYYTYSALGRTQEHGMGAVVADLIFDKRLAQSVDTGVLRFKLETLDKHLPIDSSDKFTPIDAETGKKKWGSYLDKLFQNPELSTTLGQLANVPFKVSEFKTSQS